MQCRQHSNMFPILVLCLASIAAARPSFIAVPADQIAFVDLSRLHVRVPRQTLTPPPPPPPQQQQLQHQQQLQQEQQLPQALYEEEYQPIVLQQYQQYQPYQQQPIGLAPPQEPQHPGRVVTLQQQAQDIASAASLEASSRLSERPPDFGEYVDFGAHTGDNGAFGWYADYPITNHHEHSSY